MPTALPPIPLTNNQRRAAENALEEIRRELGKMGESGSVSNQAITETAARHLTFVPAVDEEILSEVQEIRVLMGIKPSLQR